MGGFDGCDGQQDLGIEDVGGQFQPVDNSAVNAKPDNAACALVHYNQHPMRSQNDEFWLNLAIRNPPIDA